MKKLQTQRDKERIYSQLLLDDENGSSSSIFDGLLVLLVVTFPPPPDELLEFLIRGVFIATSQESHRGGGRGRWDVNGEGGDLCAFPMLCTRLDDNVSRITVGLKIGTHNQPNSTCTLELGSTAVIHRVELRVISERDCEFHSAFGNGFVVGYYGITSSESVMYKDVLGVTNGDRDSETI